MSTKIISASTIVTVEAAQTLNYRGNVTLNEKGVICGGELQAFSILKEGQEKMLGRCMLGYNNATTYNVHEYEAGVINNIASDVAQIVLDVESKVKGITLEK